MKIQQPKLINNPLFEINTVTEGDCIELMAKLPSNSIDAIVTDPPFAITGGISNGMTSRASDQFFRHWFVDVVREMTRVLKPEGAGFLWCDWRSESAMVQAFDRASERYDPWYIAQILYHDREMIGMGSPFRNQVDRIAFFRGRKYKPTGLINKAQPNIIRSYWYYGKHKWHDAEKSLEVAKMLIEWVSNKNGLILDPFTGSGTVPAACKMLSRNYLAFEIDPQTADLARQRVAETQPPLFVVEPKQLELDSLADV